MATSTLGPQAPSQATRSASNRPPVARRRALTWRRLHGRVTVWCLVASGLGGLSATAGTVVAGRLAESATGHLLSLLALCVLGAALLDTWARAVWAGVVDRAVGALRTDLLDAALTQHAPRCRAAQ